ncbi:hypothetical protein [Streptacidiphilus cavernicola]|uniref:Uncharacterized protein n=1 Tax=Streptacidiphilus cavernicola TaxID=3342716 RepID=A0ABV6VXZ6_9ACTN
MAEHLLSPAIVYVAVWNHRPIGVSGHLGDVKAAALAREFRYDTEPPERHWEHRPGDDSWQLKVISPTTGRSVMRSVFIYPTAIVDAPDAQPITPSA